MRLRTHWIPVLALSLVALVPSSARAQQTFITPYIGSSFDSSFDDYDFGTKLHYGGALTWLSGSGIGFEVDFGYAPKFFDDQATNAFDANVTSLMANLIVGIPVGGQTGPGIRPYVSGGAGLLKTRVDNVDDLFDFNENAFGINAGGGIMGFFTDNVGIRGDLRYFRAFKDTDGGTGVDLTLGSFDFWRGTLGVSFRF